MTTEQFGTLIQQYERLVYTICYQFVRDAQLAEDLTQETFLSAFTHRDDCVPEQFKPWLARIATNKAKDYLKSAYHRKVNATEDEAMEPMTVAQALAAPQPEDITLEKDAVQRIRNEILALKEPYLHVATLFFLQEQSVEEISRRLDRPPKTVHTQLYRAKQMLRQTLERERGA